VKPFLLLFSVALSAFCDQVAVNWTGNPVIVSALSNTPAVIEPIPVASQDGASADLGVTYDEQSIGGFYSNPDIPPQPTNSMSSTIDTQFTISSPADILLALTLSMQDQGSSCGDADCPQNLTSWTFAGEFSGSLDILGPDGTELSVPFTGYEAVPAVCGMICVGTVDLSDTESGNVQLAAGTYTLQTTFSSWTNTVGDGSAGGELSAVVSDVVPEPSQIWLMIGCLGIVVARSRYCATPSKPGLVPASILPEAIPRSPNGSDK
jgi:hypothetical protein